MYEQKCPVSNYQKAKNSRKNRLFCYQYIILCLSVLQQSLRHVGALRLKHLIKQLFAVLQ